MLFIRIWEHAQQGFDMPIQSKTTFAIAENMKNSDSASLNSYK